MAENAESKLDKLQSKVQRLENIAWVIAIVAGIFGIGGGWGLKAITSGRALIIDLKKSQDSLKGRLDASKGELDSSAIVFRNQRELNEALFNQTVEKKEDLFGQAVKEKMNLLAAYNEKVIMDRLPKGTILGWYNKAAIPKGWKVCDGGSGTPNLNERFAYGTIDKAKLGAAIGEATHNHQIVGTTGKEAHVLNVGYGKLGAARGEDAEHDHDINFASQKGSSIPPSTYIMFIIKI